MSEFRIVTPGFAVSPQITADDVAAARRAGYTRIVNNRPDGEAPGQPGSAEIAAAASAAGLDYAHIPVAGRPGSGEVEALRRLLEDRDGKTLAFCRSGTRSAMLWAMAEMAAGRRTRAEALDLAANAGYDLGPLLGG